MKPILDFKTNEKNEKLDFSLMNLTHNDIKIIYHALEIYYQSQKEFLKAWEYNCKIHPEIANDISEICFNEVAYVQRCIENSQNLQKIIDLACKNLF